MVYGMERYSMPQDCMDHVRGAHDVPWDVKSTSLQKFIPPWTVSAPGVDGVAVGKSFRDIDRYSPH